jgi:FkbM family methyltransferase
VGASYGAYALTAAANGATVYAFEPEPSICADLATNAHINGFHFCFPICLAMGNGARIVDMREYAKHWPQHCISGPYPATTLDETYRRLSYPDIDWIKIDVEGLEELVLAGASRLLRETHPHVLVECHDFIDEGISRRIETLLRGYRYIVERIARPPCTMLVAS